MIQLGRPMVELRGHVVQLSVAMRVPTVRKGLKSWLGAVMGAVCHESGLSWEWSVMGVVCLWNGLLSGMWRVKGVEWGGGASCCRQSVSVCRLSCPQCEHEHAQGLRVTKIIYRYIRFRVETLLATRCVFSFHFGIVPSVFFPFLFPPMV